MPEGTILDVQRCPNCGQENDAADRFCANCGTQLSSASAPTISATPVSEAPVQPVSSIPPQYPGFDSELTPSQPTGGGDENWRMSSLGPPPAKKRRLWLWVLLGLLGLCLAVCVGLAIFASTGTGQEWFEDLATRVSEQATEAAR